MVRSAAVTVICGALSVKLLRLMDPVAADDEESHMEREQDTEQDKEKEGDDRRDGTRSRSSSTSSEDYIIILPDCFDTSRPLGESMYRYVDFCSALTSAVNTVQFSL